MKLLSLNWKAVFTCESFLGMVFFFYWKWERAVLSNVRYALTIKGFSLVSFISFFNYITVYFYQITLLIPFTLIWVYIIKSGRKLHTKKCKLKQQQNRDAQNPLVEFLLGDYNLNSNFLISVKCLAIKRLSFYVWEKVQYGFDSQTDCLLPQNCSVVELLG